MTETKSKKTSSPSALSRRAALTQTVAIAGVVLLFSIAAILYNTYRLYNQVDSKIASVAALAETSLATAVWQVDHASARDFINAVLLDPDVVFAQVVTGRETMASRAKPGYAGMDFAAFGKNGQFRTIAVEIRKNGNRIGTFNLATSLQSIRRDVVISCLVTLVLAFVLIVVISQTTLYFSRAKLFNPLKRLEESATSIADGDLDAPIDTHLPGELGTLAHAIDDMRDSVRHLISDLQESKLRLEDHRNALEKTVKERTEELEQKNESLNKALDDVRNAKRAAEVANLAKSSFLASMSHEIRTPMNAILGMADILWETKLTEDQSRYVQVFRSAGENLLEILDDILDLSKIEAGRLSLEEIEFNLYEVISKTCALIEPKARSKELSFSCDIAPTAPEFLSGDPVRLKQIIINLLGNAVKFTEEGTVSLSVDPLQTENEDLLLQFTVKDTGPGIPPDKLDAIFDSFTQADSSTTRRFGGTGLGLAISKRLVSMMGGRIWVESSHGSGSAFLFTARFNLSEPIDIMPGEPLPTIEDGDLPALNLLVCEDSKYNAFVIQTYLKNTPCTLTIAENGQVGVDAFKREAFDCVLMDIQMPVMDGYEATRTIREWEAENGRARTPLIAMTAYAHSEAAQACLEAGADSHLAKPVKKSALFDALQAVSLPKGGDAESEEAEAARISVKAAYAALERDDFASVRVLGSDIENRGKALSLELLTESGAALQQAAGDVPDRAAVRRILDDLAQVVDIPGPLG
ncbi:response regulator [Pseudodesulfovibrio cashew]|uniref:Sensory/regulatory protein RpfC n=1 Tax=Pseudodesulfovibrio cashew TaxID=2678688 RepID=A0A6I6JED6_9BACT|nr:ATP-binding protein [Pseudodesulfovibrio cashew]QGY38782.1 response regulator [Pseudodesulfovibrio cashew]